MMGALLECRGLDAGYIKGSPVVRGLDLVLEAGTVTAILGPNGAGKTTVLLTVAGLQPSLGGGVLMNGQTLRKGSARTAARKGVVLVPDDRALFTGLTTRDNLALCRHRGGMTIEQVLDFFPSLAKRYKVEAGKLSGGEQQMLAVGRALMLGPRVLLIDELSMGLAPVIVEELLPIVRRVATETEAAVVLVEQHVRLALGVADHAVVLAHGAAVLSRPAAELIGDPSVLERAYMGENVTAAS
ncbi:branched-chain amino acid transport system ATP-binding protein [Nocardia kruczakiae]|uniref:Branched-chain amino acid transport system ATP-binding protein n=2 Tax=Nocardia kruczakiae TaxID=261477 RepID=A0ABU1X9Z0_9NOCA|nr:branched-chain amino acid transport system ATP-binding protein [Nocardia kruczakiae]